MARVNKEKKIASVRRITRGLPPFVVAEIVQGVIAGIAHEAVDAMDQATIESLGPDGVRNWLVALFRRPVVDPAIVTAAQMHVEQRRAELRRLACLETHAVITTPAGDDDRLASAIETALAAIRGGASCV